MIKAEVICYKIAILILSEARITEDIEDSKLTIRVRGQKWIIGGNYHSPSASDADFIDKLEDVLDDYFSVSKCILVGDINIDFKDDKNFYTNKIQRLFEVDQLVTDYTRVTDMSMSLIDYVVSNHGNIETKMHDQPKLSDHSVVSVNVFSNIASKTVKMVEIRNLKDVELIKINIDLLFCDWSINSINVNEIYENLRANITKAVNANSSKLSLSVRGDQVPYKDIELKNKARERDLAYKQFRKSGHPIDKHNQWEKYKMFRNEYVNLLKMKKRQYFEEKIDHNKHNPKTMWKTLKSLIKPVGTTTFDRIIFYPNDQKVISRCEVEIADNFNFYFVSSICDIVKSIQSDIIYVDNDLSCDAVTFLKFRSISFDELKEFILSFENKTYGEDILNIKLVKNTLHSISHVILNFINTSLAYGVFPDALKDDYCKIVRLFREEEVPHHTFPLPSERNIHAVVRGVPVNFSDTEIKGELEQRGYSPLHIIRLKRSGGTPMPLVVVILPKTEKSQQVFNEHELLGLAIRVEVQKNSRLIGQCHRCQNFCLHNIGGS
ncbi:unnamed protein product [Acanthoscelides obtectus]|uniref:Pre-C2HC domain-containing protein n=1 Tax=Acanthoscelides obtectus TaxID=200917 RepID=A0A9P0LID8_ACAOB|nr:unnamed protein product [Acanthoscelides obtectus]CAK1624419.1 hypothetical protein AOBTE_LOCUS2564 [Acanthoscelides obtectus]